MGRRRHVDDAGFTTVAALSLVLVLAVVTGLASVMAMLAGVRHQAEDAADFAALAAAGRALEGRSAACEWARTAARYHLATLESCELRGDVAVVRVSVALPGGLRPLGPVVARARAGSR